VDGWCVVICAVPQLFVANCKELRTHLSDMSLRLPRYANLDWRLDVQLSSRSLRQQFTPSLLLELETKTPSTYMAVVGRRGSMCVGVVSITSDVFVCKCGRVVCGRVSCACVRRSRLRTGASQGSLTNRLCQLETPVCRARGLDGSTQIRSLSSHSALHSLA
jgi:hypothetical protein